MTTINGVSFTLTGNPQTDLANYANARGVDEETAKQELEAAMGAPQQNSNSAPTTMITSINEFKPTGNPEGDVKKYAELKGVDEETAKQELQAKYGTPTVAMQAGIDTESALSLNASTNLSMSNLSTSYLSTDVSSTNVSSNMVNLIKEKMGIVLSILGVDSGESVSTESVDEDEEIFEEADEEITDDEITDETDDFEEYTDFSDEYYEELSKWEERYEKAQEVVDYDSSQGWWNADHQKMLSEAKKKYETLSGYKS